MDQFLKRHNFAKLTKEEIDHLNRSISSKDIESIINNIPKEKASGPNRFTGQVYQTFKGRNYTNSLQPLLEDRPEG